MSVRGIISGAVAILAFVSVGASAAENYSYERPANSFYIDVKLGRAFLDLPSSEIDGPLANAAQALGATIAPSNLSRSSGGYGLGGGYSITRNLGVEVDYYRLGNFHGTATGSYQGEQFEIMGKANVSGPAVGLVGTLPLNSHWSLDARAAEFYEKVTYSVTASTPSASSTAEVTTSARSTVILGLGLDYALFDDTSFRLEGLHFNKVVDETSGRHSIDAVTFGIRWRF